MPRGKLIKVKEATKIANLLASGKSVRETAKIVGRAPTSIQAAKAKFPEVMAEVQTKYKHRLMEEVEPSVNKIAELRDNAKSEMVQFASAKELLDRAEDTIGVKRDDKVTMIFHIKKNDPLPDRVIYDAPTVSESPAEGSE
jgi:hypothetical protein